MPPLKIKEDYIYSEDNAITYEQNLIWKSLKLKIRSKPIGALLEPSLIPWSLNTRLDAQFMPSNEGFVYRTQFTVLQKMAEIKQMRL